MPYLITTLPKHALKKPLACLALRLSLIHILKEQENKIALSVRQAYVSLVQAEAKIELSEARVNEARENLRITQLLFEADMATNVEVLAAQNQYTQSQIDALQAIYDYNMARSQFNRTIGDTAGTTGGVPES